MSEKVTVSRKLAEAIEHFKNPDGYAYENYEIMREYFSISEVVAKADNEFRLELRRTKTDLLMSALINGYEVEKSPEEKVRAYYNEFSVDKRHLTGSQYAVGYAILNTLNILGIKIEGVNG